MLHYKYILVHYKNSTVYKYIILINYKVSNLFQKCWDGFNRQKSIHTIYHINNLEEKMK